MLQEHRAEIAKVVPAGERGDKLNTVAEMALAFGLEQCQQLCEDCADAVGTVEAMLRQQVLYNIYTTILLKYYSYYIIVL